MAKGYFKWQTFTDSPTYNSWRSMRSRCLFDGENSLHYKQKGITICPEWVDNFDQFEEDCLNDMRFNKILSKMLDEDGSMERAFGNFENIRSVIDLFELEIGIIEGDMPVLSYEGKHQLMDFLRIIRDSYYKSLICEQPGIDNRI